MAAPAARTAPSAIPATGADMNTADGDATAKVAVTSNAVTWVSASAISFGDVAAAAGADSGHLEPPTFLYSLLTH